MGVEKCGEKNILRFVLRFKKTIRDWALCERQTLPGKQRLERRAGCKVGTRWDE